MVATWKDEQKLKAKLSLYLIKHNAMKTLG
jgi:hypothetical protein